MKRNVADCRGRAPLEIVLSTSVAFDAAEARIRAKGTIW